MSDWLQKDIPILQRPIHRVGIVGNYGISPETFEAALEAGINYVFWTPKMRKITPVLKAALKRDRASIVLATGPTFSYFGGSLQKGADSIRRLLDIDQIDLFQQFWLGKTAAETASTREALLTLRESGAVRHIGTSIHDRPRAGQLARDRVYDMLMVRYNAAHPGAEQDIFPHVDPAATMLTAYTATRWRKLLKRPRGWTGFVPSAADCYRFCLSHTAVDVVLMGVKTREQLAENLRGLEQGPMVGDEMAMMREFGRVVHG